MISESASLYCRASFTLPVTIATSLCSFGVHPHWNHLTIYSFSVFGKDTREVSLPYIFGCLSHSSHSLTFTYITTVHFVVKIKNGLWSATWWKVGTFPTSLHSPMQRYQYDEIKVPLYSQKPIQTLSRGPGSKASLVCSDGKGGA